MKDDAASKREHARTIGGGLVGLVLVVLGIGAAFNGSGGLALLLIFGGVAAGLGVRFLT